MAERVSLRGWRELDAAVVELGKSTGKNVLRRTGKVMLEPMRAAAEEHARKRSGHLKLAIKIGSRLAHSQRGGPTARYVGGGKVRSDPRNDVTMYMGPGQQPQAITEEFGTSDQAPHPFMRAAFDAHAAGAIRAAGPLLWNEIAKAAARKAKKAAKGGG